MLVDVGFGPVVAEGAVDERNARNQAEVEVVAQSQVGSYDSQVKTRRVV